MSTVEHRLPGWWRDVSEDAFPCRREGCGHPPSWHRHDDASSISIVSPEAKFRCLGYDCEAPGPLQPLCGCPDYLELAGYLEWVVACAESTG